MDPRTLSRTHPRAPDPGTFTDSAIPRSSLPHLAQQFVDVAIAVAVSQQGGTKRFCRLDRAERDGPAKLPPAQEERNQHAGIEGHEEDCAGQEAVVGDVERAHDGFGGGDALQRRAVRNGDGGAEHQFANGGQDVRGGVRPGHVAMAVGGVIGVEVHASHGAGPLQCEHAGEVEGYVAGVHGLGGEGYAADGGGPDAEAGGFEVGVLDLDCVVDGSGARREDDGAIANSDRVVDFGDLECAGRANEIACAHGVRFEARCHFDVTVGAGRIDADSVEANGDRSNTIYSTCFVVDVVWHFTSLTDCIKSRCGNDRIANTIAAFVLQRDRAAAGVVTKDLRKFRG